MERMSANNFGACKTLVMERERLRSTLSGPATLIDLPSPTTMDWHLNSAYKT